MATRDSKDPSRKHTTSDTPTGGSYASTAGADEQPGLIDTNAEETYWRQNYATRPYVTAGTPYTEYKNAYRHGVDAHTRYPGRSWDQVESELGRDWDRFKGTSSFTWEKARHAARDAWQRVKDAMERAMPGDSDRDGR